MACCTDPSRDMVHIRCYEDQLSLDPRVFPVLSPTPLPEIIGTFQRVGCAGYIIHGL